MSRAVRWQMQFMSKTGTVYTVSIYDEGWTGSVTTLTPANEPFFTQEDSDNDAFVPVRYSTGYLRFIVEDLSIIDNIMTTEVDGRYVTLTKYSSGSNVVVWQGYMQAQSFNGAWEAAPYEVEFPIISSLGILDNMPYTPIRQFMTLGYLLKRAITNNYTDFDTWHTPLRGETHDLLATINDDIFRNDNDDEWENYLGYNANVAFPEDKMTCMTVIKEICNYFGWSLREQGKDLYFVSVKGTSNYQYGTIAGITQTTLTISGSETVNTISVADVQSTNNDREFLQGYGYFEITEELETPSNPINFDLTQVEPDDPTVNSTLDILYIIYGNINNDIMIASAENNGDVLQPYLLGKFGCQLTRGKFIQTYSEFLLDNSDRSEYSPMLVMRNGTSQKTATYQSTRIFVGRNYIGGLALSGSVKYMSGGDWANFPENDYVVMQIKWGNKYLNRVNGDYVWNTTAGTINVPIANGSIHGGFIPVNSSSQTLLRTSPTDLFYIPVDNSLTGTLQITFYSKTAESVENSVYFFTDISLDAFKSGDVSVYTNVNYKTNLFKYVSGLGGSNVYSRENMLCSAMANVQICNELVLTNDKTNALATYPEIDTVTRMAAMYGQPKEQLWLDISYTNLQPYDIVSVNSQNYYCASVESRWRDDQIRIQLQKL